jgi:hypothetical protein
MAVDTIIEQDCAGGTAHAARLGLSGPTPETPVNDKRLRFEWRVSEHAVLFRTDEFDQAQLTSRTTSLVTGRGEYLIRLSLPSHYELFFTVGEGGVQVEGCATGTNESPVSCRIIGNGQPGCFQLGYRLPPIDSARAGGNASVPANRCKLRVTLSRGFTAAFSLSTTLMSSEPRYVTAREKPAP